MMQFYKILCWCYFCCECVFFLIIVNREMSAYSGRKTVSSVKVDLIKITKISAMTGA